MTSLVFVVEDETEIKNLLAKYLEAKGISHMFASNLQDSIELFRRNRELITHIALDGNLHHQVSEHPETLPLAQLIAGSRKFKGMVFPMSCLPGHNDILKKVIGERCHSPLRDRAYIKIDTIKMIRDLIVRGWSRIGV